MICFGANRHDVVKFLIEIVNPRRAACKLRLDTDAVIMILNTLTAGNKMLSRAASAQPLRRMIQQ